MKFYRLASGFPTKSGSLLPTKRGRELPTLTTFLAAYRFHFRLRTILYQLVSALEIEARRRAYM